MDFIKKGNNKNKFSAGFSLIELLTSIFIIGLISGVAIYNHKEFTDHLEITNLAYAMALSIREAQVSGVSVKVDTDASIGDEFKSPYGASFNISTGASASGNNKAYVMFIDKDRDDLYDGDFTCNSIECLQKIEIGRGNFISDVCMLISDGSATDCGTYVGVDMIFKRPKPDAILNFLKSGGGYTNNVPNGIKGALICLKSPEERKRSIKILTTGQISVEKGVDCPST